MTRDISTIIATSKFKAASNILRTQHERFVEEIIKLTEIPSPPFKEEVRAKAYEKMFRDIGLTDVTRDKIGNVTGVRRGRSTGQLLAVAAHLDTVFPEGTDCTVRRDGTKLYAPGIGDDTRGLAVLLTLNRALNEANIVTEKDILFVGDVGEEGAGDLRGMRFLFTEGAYTGKIGEFITIDGLDPGKITTVGVGSLRYRVVFRGPGGHSLNAFGTVNPAHAMAHLVEALSRLEVPQEPRTTYCAARFGGGTSINAIPDEAWVEIDLRSESQTELDRLDARLKSLIDDAVETENRRGDTASGEITSEAIQIGNRPAGRTSAQERIVTCAFAAVSSFGFEPEEDASSTDANMPMSLGIPSIRLGSGGTGGRAHSLDEWIDVEIEESLRGLNAALATILALAGVQE